MIIYSNIRRLMENVSRSKADTTCGNLPFRTILKWNLSSMKNPVHFCVTILREGERKVDKSNISKMNNDVMNGLFFILLLLYIPVVLPIYLLGRFGRWIDEKFIHANIFLTEDGDSLYNYISRGDH